MGNQLFQLAAVTHAALQDGAQIHISAPTGSREFALNWLGITADKTYYPRIVNAKLIYEVQAGLRLPPFATHKEAGFNFDRIPSLSRNTRIDGYFQSFKYFQEIHGEFAAWIRNHASIKTRNDVQDKIVLHIRLGDIARNPEFRNFHGVLSSDYYIQAINFFEIANPLITIITDDIEMLRVEHGALLDTYKNAKIISSGMQDDFVYLASSRNLIIANSTYSWWAAAVSNAKVIAPLSWFSSKNISFVHDDFYLKDWEVM